MSKIKTLNAKRYVAVFMAMLITILSLSYTGNKTNAETTGKTRTYRRHNYSSKDLSTYARYALTINPSNNKSSRIIFDPNDMEEDYDTAVVRLEATTGSYGTGFIVDEHTIATAAHCIYSQKDDAFLSLKILIIDSNNNVIKTISPHYAHINEEFTKYENYLGDSPLYDYAMLYVDEDLSQYGKFNLGVALDGYVNKKGDVTVSGFPDNKDYPDGYENADWGIRFKAKGNITRDTDKMLMYNTDVTSGDSGGSAYIEEKMTLQGKTQEYKTAIAINVGNYDDYNTGVKITAEILQFYGDNPKKTI